MNNWNLALLIFEFTFTQGLGFFNSCFHLPLLSRLYKVSSHWHSLLSLVWSLSLCSMCRDHLQNKLLLKAVELALRKDTSACVISATAKFSLERLMHFVLYSCSSSHLFWYAPLTQEESSLLPHTLGASGCPWLQGAELFSILFHVSMFLPQM